MLKAKFKFGLLKSISFKYQKGSFLGGSFDVFFGLILDRLN